MTASRGPNIFDYATGELSQDAFICWLASWAAKEHSSTDPDLHDTARTFISSLFDKAKRPPPADIQTMQVFRQYKHIDILLVVNGTHAILIEDKTYTVAHSGQLRRYMDTLREGVQTAEGRLHFHDATIVPVYFKTVDQSNYRRIHEEGYYPYLRKDLLKVLRSSSAQRVRNSIFVDYCHRLESMDARTVFVTQPLLGWSKDPFPWSGFYIELQKRLGDGDWSYVPNPSGGFHGFWWHWRVDTDNPAVRPYLQLEQSETEGHLCFQIEVADPALQTKSRNIWSERIRRAATLRPETFSFARIRKGTGRFMTVAQAAGDVRFSTQAGLLDIERTVERLRQAEDLLDLAVGDEVRLMAGKL